MRHHLQIRGTIPNPTTTWRYQTHGELQLIWDGKLLPEEIDMRIDCPLDDGQPITAYSNTVTINGHVYKNCKVTMEPLG